MKKISVSPHIPLALLLAALLAAAPAKAGVLDRIRNAIGGLSGQSAAQREKARDAKNKAAAINDQADAVHDRLEKAQQLLVRANGVFLEYSYQAKQTEARIVETRHRVQIVTARYKKHKALFGQRLASIQHNGQLSYLNMLLGSRTLSDLSRRMYLYQAIASRDSDLQTAIKNDKQELERAQNDLMAQWQHRNRLVQAANKERARIVLAERDQQKYLKELKSSMYAQLAYAEVQEQTARSLEGDIQQLESQRAQIIANYEAQQAAARRARYESSDAAPRRRVRRYTRKRVARNVTRTKYVRSEGGTLKPMEVKSVVYEDVMVPDDKGGELGEDFQTDGGGYDDDGGWRRPANGRLSSRYGVRYHPILHRRKLHTGDDIAAGYGSSIKAAKGGRVLYSGWKKGYGNTVIIDHGGGVTTLYGHASKLDVKAGQPVKGGQTIANVGSTGYSTGPHLHFEVRKNGKPINPTPYLKKSR
jgi:murein DD-endopeptidase MepM/ murein hydrolase activator NlpD